MDDDRFKLLSQLHQQVCVRSYSIRVAAVYADYKGAPVIAGGNDKKAPAPQSVGPAVLQMGRR